MPDLSAALAAVAVTSADAARDAAERAECVVRMRGYANDSASVQAARQYASCVYALYGTGRPFSFIELLFLKAAFLLTVSGAIFGGLRIWRQGHYLGMTVLGGAFGALGGALAAAMLAGLWFGFRFVFS